MPVAHTAHRTPASRERWTRLGATLLCLCAWAAAGCGGDRCGPASATVSRVIDGDTIELESGEKVRYLLVDTPEISSGTPDCYGIEARDYNRELVEGKRVSLSYDRECTDAYDRLLAYVSVQDRVVNALLVERGFACVLVIPPNGADREAEYLELEAIARAESRGMWGVCEEVACD